MRDLLLRDPGIATPSTPAAVKAFMPLYLPAYRTGVYPLVVNARYRFVGPHRNISTIPSDFWDTPFAKRVSTLTGAKIVKPVESDGEFQLGAYDLARLEGVMELGHGVRMRVASAHLLYVDSVPREWVSVYPSRRAVYHMHGGSPVIWPSDLQAAAQKAKLRVLADPLPLGFDLP